MKRYWKNVAIWSFISLAITASIIFAVLSAIGNDRYYEKIYDDGYRARLHNASEFSCPWDSGNFKSKWMQGWLKANEELNPVESLRK